MHSAQQANADQMQGGIRTYARRQMNEFPRQQQHWKVRDMKFDWRSSAEPASTGLQVLLGSTIHPQQTPTP
jgi:hypothetical protein